MTWPTAGRENRPARTCWPPCNQKQPPQCETPTTCPRSRNRDASLFHDGDGGRRPPRAVALRPVRQGRAREAFVGDAVAGVRCTASATTTTRPSISRKILPLSSGQAPRFVTSPRFAAPCCRSDASCATLTRYSAAFWHPSARPAEPGVFSDKCEQTNPRRASGAACKRLGNAPGDRS